MSDALISRSGLLTFAHDFLRTAVQNAYLPTEQNQRQAHLRLADSFRPALSATDRLVDEILWQLFQAQAWQQLSVLLTDRDTFMWAWMRDRYDVQTYWTQIQSVSSLRIVSL